MPIPLVVYGLVALGGLLFGGCSSSRSGGGNREGGAAAPATGASTYTPPAVAPYSVVVPPQRPARTGTDADDEVAGMFDAQGRQMGIGPNGAFHVRVNNLWVPVNPHSPPGAVTFRENGADVIVTPAPGDQHYLEMGGHRYEIFTTAGESPVIYRRQVGAAPGNAPVADTPWQRFYPASEGREVRWVNVTAEQAPPATDGSAGPTTRSHHAGGGRRSSPPASVNPFNRTGRRY